MRLTRKCKNKWRITQILYSLNKNKIWCGSNYKRCRIKIWRMLTMNFKDMKKKLNRNRLRKLLMILTIFLLSMCSHNCNKLFNFWLLFWIIFLFFILCSCQLKTFLIQKCVNSIIFFLYFWKLIEILINFVCGA